MKKLERPIDPPPCLVELDSEVNKWSDVDKAQVWEHLQLMQNGFCCYCEKRAIKGNGHIEHFYHQGSKSGQTPFKHLKFKWDNLFGCCGSEYADTCGHYKDSGGKKGGPGSYDPDVLIKPDKDNPEMFFGFTDEGGIYIRGDLTTNDFNRAKETIRVLKLDDSVLVEQRKRLIKSVEAEYQFIFEGADDSEILDQDVLRLVESIRCYEHQTAVLDVYGLNN